MRHNVSIGRLWADHHKLVEPAIKLEGGTCCDNPIIIQATTIRDYIFPVNTPGVTDEIPAAHGSISFYERCRTCQSNRRVNTNGAFKEVSAWTRPPQAKQISDRQQFIDDLFHIQRVTPKTKMVGPGEVLRGGDKMPWTSATARDASTAARDKGDDDLAFDLHVIARIMYHLETRAVEAA